MENGKTKWEKAGDSSIKLFWTGHSWDCFWGGYSPESSANTPVPPLTGYDGDKGSTEIVVKYEYLKSDKSDSSSSSESEIPTVKAIMLTEQTLEFSGNADSFEGGALYTLGTCFGARDYRNPFISGEVDVAFSHDAANYYSTTTGHIKNERRMTGELICSQDHPGGNATMWSRGAPGAWFSVDLKNAELDLTHYCYRGDAGGGENHPRSWELSGVLRWSDMENVKETRRRQFCAAQPHGIISC
eukprot:g1854.t1